MIVRVCVFMLCVYTQDLNVCVYVVLRIIFIYLVKIINLKIPRCYNIYTRNMLLINIDISYVILYVIL